jgi:hypothetical protein
MIGGEKTHELKILGFTNFQTVRSPIMAQYNDHCRCVCIGRKPG